MDKNSYSKHPVLVVSSLYIDSPENFRQSFLTHLRNFGFPMHLHENGLSFFFFQHTS